MKVRKIKACNILLGLAVLALIFGCKGNNTSDSISSSSAASGVRSELPLPYIPDSLTTSEERSEYAVMHYWDMLELSRRKECHDTAFMEQSFSNFIVLLPYVSEEVRLKGVTKLIDRCKLDPEVLRLITWVAYKYLDEPNSPMRSEELYIPFLQILNAGDNHVPEEIRERAAFRLTQAMKNRPGARGADFRLITRDGISSTLHKTLAADTTLVMFYDPDCDNCRQITRRLAEQAADIPYRILAIDVIDNRQLWDSTKHTLPADWQVAYATDPIDDQELYVFPALPSFYLFAPDATVLLKDFPLHFSPVL